MKLLIVDDEKSIRMALKATLSKMTSNIYTAETGREGLDIFEKFHPDVVILDIKLPDIDGLEILRRIRQTSSNTYVIMITYLTEVRLAIKAMKMGAFDYFTKPFKLDDVKNIVMEIKEKYIDMEKIPDDPMTLSRILGNSPKLIETVNKIVRLPMINQDISILITGESGTGKELVAKSIHYLSPRAQNPFIALNCPAIPKNLQESVLFGHEKGAFTDAHLTKKGLLEEAQGGTLFFDEIGDMDPSLQSKLLRVLQEKKFRRLGSNKEIDLSANIIYATNKDLLKEIELGNFRLDLYYRINIIQINIPPLRDRKEDIPGLIHYYIELFNSKYMKNIIGVAPQAREALINYEWPGNIRELRNILERIIVFLDKDIIGLNDLPEEILQVKNGKNLPYLEQVEGNTIYQVLEKNSWNITASAKELGISRLTLRRKIEKYNLK